MMQMGIAVVFDIFTVNGVPGIQTNSIVLR